MFICAAGDIHGAMDRLYDDVLAFKESLGACFDYVLHDAPAGVCCIGLNKVAMPGNLVAIDISAREREYEILAEWPRREQLSS